MAHPALAERNQRDFGGREETVHENQEENEE
jgi:hypothetical protein